MKHSMLTWEFCLGRLQETKSEWVWDCPVLEQSGLCLKLFKRFCCVTRGFWWECLLLLELSYLTEPEWCIEVVGVIHHITQNILARGEHLYLWNRFVFYSSRMAIFQASSRTSSVTIKTLQFTLNILENNWIYKSFASATMKYWA